MPPTDEPPVVSVVSVRARGGGLHEVVLRLHTGERVRLVIASEQTTMQTVRMSAHAVLTLWSLQVKQGKKVT